jgi:PAS domain-containing protein
MLAGEPLRRPGTSPSAEPPLTSPLRVLTQHPVPVVAAADDGALVFANTAFAKLFGCSRTAVTSMSYEDICSLLPPDETLVAVTRLGPNAIGRLLELGEATLFVKMRRSAILSAADSGPVMLFEGLM